MRVAHDKLFLIVGACDIEFDLFGRLVEGNVELINFDV